MVDIDWDDPLDDEVKLTDESTMPFGKHKGDKLKDVPNKYLMWLWEQDWLKEKYLGLYLYIEDNFDAIDRDSHDYDPDDWGVCDASVEDTY